MTRVVVLQRFSYWGIEYRKGNRKERLIYYFEHTNKRTFWERSSVGLANVYQYLMGGVDPPACSKPRTIPPILRL